MCSSLSLTYFNQNFPKNVAVPIQNRPGKDSNNIRIKFTYTLSIRFDFKWYRDYFIPSLNSFRLQIKRATVFSWVTWTF